MVFYLGRRKERFSDCWQGLGEGLQVMMRERFARYFMRIWRLFGFLREVGQVLEVRRSIMGDEGQVLEKNLFVFEVD